MMKNTSMQKSKKHQNLLIEQVRIWKIAKKDAGPRYTAEVNINLPIKDIFEGIGRTDNFFKEVTVLVKEFRETFKPINSFKIDTYKNATLQKRLEKIKEAGKILSKEITILSKSKKTSLNLVQLQQSSEKLVNLFYPTQALIRELQDKEKEKKEKKDKGVTENEGHSESKEVDFLRRLNYILDNFYPKVRNIRYFSRTHKALLYNEPILLIVGEAGMGKTHLICDVALERINRGLPPTIVVLGEKLVNIKDPLESVFKACNLKKTKDSILKELNRLGKNKSQRSLIIIDAINEADYLGWKKNYKKILEDLKKYPWIGVVMTCRNPFQNIALPKRKRLVTEWHTGFSEYELEAMSAYFSFYKLPLPEIPLLISEFSNPLFLSCFCKSAFNLNDGKGLLARRIKGLSQGHAGMTKILEDFYKNKDKEIYNKHKQEYPLIIKPSWLWKNLIKEMAEQMALNGDRYLENDAVIAILQTLSNNSYDKKTCEEILTILVESGILIRDGAWDGKNNKYFVVIKFPFHKFSDHLIARYLLTKKYFNPNKIRKSLEGDTSLGKIFKDKNSILENIDLIEALMAEFPERVKSVKKVTDRDLIDYLPKESLKYTEVRNAYINSLYWRRPDNFLNNKNQVKESIIKYFNKVLLHYKSSNKSLLDLLVSTALKPQHPLNHKRLDKYLSSLSMKERDLRWSEFLREGGESGNIRKLLSWIEEHEQKRLDLDQAEAIITVLSWVLTSNDRLLRDRATRCIYLVGRMNPKACFNVAQIMISKNDLYVVERVLAGCYGISLALHRKKDDHEFIKLLNTFSKKIYTSFFKKGAIHSTTHIIIRDYAQGILELAYLHSENIFTKSQVKKFRPPYSMGGIRRWGRSKDLDKGIYRDGNSPMHMDFENYTLGRLVKDRSNYDFKNIDYIRVKDNIFWRIYQLGYSLKSFGEIDKEISRQSTPTRADYIGKVDRYGKKYCWIAYNELFGFRADKNQINEFYLSEELRYIDTDLDPGFPVMTSTTNLLKRNLTKGQGSLKEWMVQKSKPDISDYLIRESLEGENRPWVLVGGTIGEKNEKRSRRITIFVKAILISKEKENLLKEFFNKTKYFGNDTIPNLPDVRDRYAAELGWREPKKNDKDFIKILRGKKRRKLTRNEMKIYNIRLSYSGIFGEMHEIKTAEKIKTHIDENVYEKFQIEVLDRWLSSKDYSKMRNENGVGIHIPSKKFIQSTEIFFDNDSFGFLDKKGDRAVVSYANGDQYGTNENLLYISKDLIDKYLKKNKKELYIIAWGEREYWPSNLERIHRDEFQEIYQKYKNVHKQLLRYNSKRFVKN